MRAGSIRAVEPRSLEELVNLMPERPVNGRIAAPTKPEFRVAVASSCDVSPRDRGLIVPEEITSICADFLVELRGFEPMHIAGATRS